MPIFYGTFPFLLPNSCVIQKGFVNTIKFTYNYTNTRINTCRMYNTK